MTDINYLNYLDPLGGNSDIDFGSINSETNSQDEGNNYDTMDLLELATCIETDQEPIEFTSADAVLYPKTGLMVCILCLEDVDSNLLNDHMVNAHGFRKVKLRCQLCSTKFVERGLLTAHKKDCRLPEKRHKRKSLQQILTELECNDPTDTTPDTCQVCSLELPGHMLKDHLITEHISPETSLTCGVCKRSFKNKATLRDHVKLVHELVEETEECEICGLKFRSQKYLGNHRRNVHASDNKSHTCPTCGKSFKSKLSLHQHTKYVHPPPSAAAQCPHCPGKVFKSKINLKQHLRIAHGCVKKDPETVDTCEVILTN